MKTSLRQPSGGGPGARWTAHWTSGDDITLVLGFLITEVTHTEAFTTWTNNKPTPSPPPTNLQEEEGFPSAFRPLQLPSRPSGPSYSGLFHFPWFFP